MTASTGGNRETHTAPERRLSSLDTLPRVGIRDLARDHGRFFRPGRQRSPLWGLGDRFLIDVHMGPKVVITSSPQDAKAVFADRDGALSFGEMLRRFTPHEPLFGSDAYIFREGEAHLTERRKIAPPLHGKVLKSYERAMVDIVLRRLPDYPLGKPVRFSTIGGQLALDVMMTVIFGVSKPERMRRLERAMLAYCGVAQGPSFLGVGVLSTVLRGRWLSIPRLARTAAAVDAIVLEEIAERRRTGSRSDDCLTIYLELNEQEAEPYDDAFLARSMRGLMLAGHAATSVTIGWFGDLLVPRGAFIIIAIMALHERADLYPDPLAFRPERFLGSRPQPYTWVPFGGGVHYCLGAEFALFEARVLLRTLLQHRRLRAVDGRRGGRSSLTHPLPVPAGGAPIVLTARD